MKWTWDRFGYTNGPVRSDPEKAVLACMMLCPECCDVLLSKVGEGNFVAYAHRVLFRHIKSVYQSENSFNILSIYKSLELSGESETCSAIQLVSVFTSIPSATIDSAEQYVRAMLGE